MKRILIVGNWKMNLSVHEASLLIKRLNDRVPLHRDIEVAIAPNMLALQPISQQIDHRKFSLCAQDAYFKDEGAYTGEVSFTMLRGLVKYALIGHSERRIYFNESLETIRDKMQAAVRNGIIPILCVGETDHERSNGETKQVIHDQVESALSNLTSEELSRIVIAYEPVWAISGFGGKRPATPDEIQEAVDWIRHVVSSIYVDYNKDNLKVIYGASVEAEFVGQILGLPGVDGLLPGSASLNYAKFSAIVEAAYEFLHKS